MRRRTRATSPLHRGAGLLACFLIFVIGCSKGNYSKTAYSPTASEFRWGVRSPISTLDPVAASDDVTTGVLQQVYQGLVQIDEKGYVEPLLASSWGWNAKDCSYRLRLEERAKFSDGHPVTAEDVRFSLLRALNPANRGGLVQTYLSDIVGFEPGSKTIGIDVLDPNTIRIRLKEPQSSFLSRLAYPAMAIVEKGVAPAARNIASVKEMIGSGPFVASSYAEGQQLVLLAKSHYWYAPASVDKVTVKVIQDDNTRRDLFKTGGLDLTVIKPADLADVRSDTELQSHLKITPRAGFNYLQLNDTSLPALRNPLVRRALAMAIDRDRLVKDILLDLYRPANGILPPEIRGSIPTPPAIPFDPQGARRLLAQAGYPNGRGFPTLELCYKDNRRGEPIVDAIVTDWRTNLGIDATGRGMDSKMLTERNLKGELPAFITGWTGDYADPDNYLPNLFSSTSSENRSGFKDQQVDQWLAEAARTPKHKGREVLYGKIEARVLELMPVIPLYFPTEAELVSDRFEGLKFSPYGHLSLTGLKLRR